MANRGASRQAADPIARLAELLEVALNVQTPRDRFKPPKFNGRSDVELFIANFTEVSIANQWDQNTALINLRLSLEKDAIECSRGPDVQTIYNNLRARFGLSVQQARDKLASIKRENGQTHHMLGLEVRKLVRLAYPTMGANDQTIIAIETVKRSIDNRKLSQHLLAVPADTLEAVTAAADAFLQAGQMPNTRYNSVNAFSMDSNDDDRTVKNAIDSKPRDSTSDLLIKLLTAVEQNTAAIAGLVKQGQSDNKSVRFTRSRSSSRAQEQTTHSDQCYHSGSDKHYIQNCSHNQENSPGPQ